MMTQFYQNKNVINEEKSSLINGIAFLINCVFYLKCIFYSYFYFIYIFSLFTHLVILYL